MKITKLGKVLLVCSLLGIAGSFAGWGYLYNLATGQKTEERIKIDKDFVPRPIAVHFSPHGGCTDAIVKEIDAAQDSIYFQAYSFTNQKIADALVRAHKRGVKVFGLMDKSDTKEKSSLDDLIGSGINVLIDAKHAIAHNKIMIIDGRTVITGSFNFTNQAETSNAENLLIIDDPILAKKYYDNWKVHEAHSIKR